MDVKRRGTQDIALNGDSISVPHHHLQDRFQPHEFEVNTGRQTGEAHHTGLVVRDIDGVHMILDHFGLFRDRRRIASPGGDHIPM